ncbi:RDD family protein [Couchioplanes caeruleus]|uniref:RDD family protein n=1 Tax=Couchioplanes caeruleus TaxID=56438 RepID=A0A3N1GN14_9ACTN|nr:RDD family protein [Couchioplanes caeruleus]
MPLSPDGRPLADFGTRLLAYMIDAVILGAVAMVLFLPPFAWFMVNAMSDIAARSDPSTPGTPVAVEYEQVFNQFFLPLLLLELGFFVFLLVAYYVYYVEMMFRSGRTLGKKLMKVQVVPLEPGATLTRGMAARRYLVECVGGSFVPFLGLLDGLWQLWDKPYQQTLHDKVAKTIVIKVAP